MSKHKNEEKHIENEELKEEEHCCDDCHCEDDCECDDECGCDEESCHREEPSEELIKKNIKLEESLLRLNSELQNYKRRKDEEVMKLRLYANEDLIKEVLPILDNFERAIIMDDDNLSDEVSKFLTGVKMIYANLCATLDKYGVKEIESLNKTFDPNLHEAVMMETYEDKAKDIVLEVFQKGYTINGKLLRPAMVKVNK